MEPDERLAESVTQGRGQGPATRSQRVLRAILPIGVVLMIMWILWLAVEIAIRGDSTQSGFSIVSAVLGLLTSLTLIVSGIHFRRALDAA